MRNPIYALSKATFYLLLLSPIFFIACDPATTITTPTEGEEMEEVEQMSPPPSDEAVKQFFHAWMADCANDHYKEFSNKNEEQALIDLRQLAKVRIDSALSDPAISGSFGKETRVWGPAVEVTEEASAEDYYYIIKNLMYCTHSTIGGVNHYSIGIAGTNAISKFDWLTEDVNQNTTTDTTLTGGKISKGSETGLNILKALKDSTLQQSLLAFLQEKIQEDPNAVISVAGHSLGGALTQVYSSYLKKQLGDAANVSAWVYAGPTAGDETFATNLVDKLGAENYHAYNNALDVVPHVWQADSLSKICSIYEGQKYCRWEIGENLLINLVGEYLSEISQEGNYTIPLGQNHSFTVTLEPNDLVECADFFAATVLETSKFDDVPFPYSLIENLNNLHYLCKTPKSQREEINVQLMMFLAEMAEQHTTAYTDYFFQAQNSAFKAAVAKYTAASTKQEIDNAEEGVTILNAFLGNVYSEMVSKSPKCQCN